VPSQRYRELEKHYLALERWQQAATSERQSVEFLLLLTDTLWEMTKLVLTKEEIAEIEADESRRFPTCRRRPRERGRRHFWRRQFRVNQ
jgi:hypothetical protein